MDQGDFDHAEQPSCATNVAKVKHNELIPCESPGEKLSSNTWGVWPGLASLTRSNTVQLTPTSSNTLSTLRTKHHHKSKPNTPKDATKCYQMKDRILFTGKPPVIPPVNFNTTNDRTSANDSSTNVVLLSGLPWWMSDCDIRECCHSYGQIRAVRVINDPVTGSSTGLALIQFTAKTAALSMINDKVSSLSARSGLSVSASLVPPPTLDSLFNELGIELAEHWAYGLPFNNVFLLKLYQVANMAPPETITSINPANLQASFRTSPFNIYQTQKDEHDGMSSQEIPNDFLIDASSPPVCEAVSPTISNTQFEETKQDQRKTEFRLPFVVAAAAATALLDRLNEERHNERAAKRLKSSEKLDVSMLNKEQAQINSTDDIQDYSFLERMPVPFWERPMHTLPRLPLATITNEGSHVVTRRPGWRYPQHPGVAQQSLRPPDVCDDTMREKWNLYPPGIMTQNLKPYNCRPQPTCYTDLRALDQSVTVTHPPRSMLPGRYF